MTLVRYLQVVAGSVVAAALHAAAHAGVADGFVEGSVSAASRSYLPVSNEFGDAVYPGHRLTITLSGSADINWKRRWKEECFILCKRHEWIDHNFQTPDKWPVLFQLLDEGGAVQHEFASVNGAVVYLVPTGKMADYNRKLRLVAKLSPGIPPVDPDQTQGEFKARIEVSTSDRLGNLPLFLSEVTPRQDAAMLKKAWLTDPFFMEQNAEALARVLVEYARNVFPVSNPSNADAHRELLEYAGEIDRTGIQAGSALAQMYLDQGNAQSGQAELIKVIKALQQKTAAGAGAATQIALGEAYLKLASAIGMASGIPDAQARAGMSANYTAAIAIAESTHAPMLAVQAYAGRAAMNRARNTLEALNAAEKDFRSARDRLPARIAGIPLDVAMGGKELLLLDRPDQMDVAWSSLQAPGGTPTPVPVPGLALRPYAVAKNGRVLAGTSRTLGWLDITSATREFSVLAQLPTEMAGGSTNGTAAMVILSPAAGEQQFSSMLVAPGQESRPVLFEGMPTSLAIMAANAPRYVVHGMVPPKPGAAPPPTLAFELREIGKLSDATVRRITATSWAGVLRYRISSDGKKIAALVDDVSGPQPKRRLLVWDDASSQHEVVAQLLAPTGFGGYGPAPGMVPGISPFQPPLADSTLVDFDFSPGGDELLTVNAAGQLATMAAIANAPVKLLDGQVDPAAGRFVRAGFIAAAGTGQTVVDGDYESGRVVSVLDWATRQVTRLNADKVTEPLLGPVGYVRMPDGRLGAVQTALPPFKIRTLRAADASVIAEDAIVLKELGMVRALSGGRYLCLAGSTIVLRDLAQHTETVVKTLPPALTPTSEQATCLPHIAQGRWTLLTHRNGVVSSAQIYMGAKPVAAANTMPHVPAELVQQEEAAAKRIGMRPVPPAFFMPPMALGGEGAEPYRDGTQFALAVSAATYQEALRNPGKTIWTSVPYVMLQQETLAVQYARVPADGVILKILPAPANKLIYQRGQNIFWKPLATETEGKLLLEFALSTSPMAPPESQPVFWSQFRASLDRDRLLIAGVNANRDTGASVAEKRLFRVVDDGIFPMACEGCAKQAFNTKEMLKDNLGAGPLPVLNAPVDSALENHVVYGTGHASIYNVSRNALTGALPATAIFWVGEGQAYFVSGKNELSMVRF